MYRFGSPLKQQINQMKLFADYAESFGAPQPVPHATSIAALDWKAFLSLQSLVSALRGQHEEQEISGGVSLTFEVLEVFSGRILLNPLPQANFLMFVKHL